MLIIVPIALAAAPGEAPPLALHPAYQRLAELKAVAEQAAMVPELRYVPAERIEYVSTDLYRVTAGKCRIDARIIDLPVPEGVVGGRRFEVRLGKGVCRK